MTAKKPDLLIPESTEVLLAIQERRRRQAVIHARRSPYLAAGLEGVNLDHVCQPEEWAKLPILNKDDLRALSPQDFYQEFCIGSRTEVSEYWRSGGSTGRPLFYPRTAEDVRFGMAGFMRVLDLAGFGDDDIVHMSLPLGIHPAGHMMARAGCQLGNGMVWAGGGNNLPSPAQIDLINLFAPTAWIGMASYGIQLGNLARSEGVDTSASSIAKILCTAEPLSVSKRKKLSDIWGASVHDSFGMTELMMLAGEDAAHDGFRFWADFCYPEVVDQETYEPVGEGEEGLLLVTSLVTNNMTPFIRWNTGDIVAMRPGQPQNSPYDVFPVIKHAHRTAGFVKVRGANIGFTDFEDLMFRRDDVADFRAEVISENDRDELDIHVEFAETTERGTAEADLKSDVKRAFEVTPRVVHVPKGTVARAFEGQIKPARFTDKRSS